MKLVIDGTEYELDSDFFVDAWYKATLPYVDPANEKAKKYADIRLAAKGVLRFYLKSILKTFAQIFHIENWRDLEPARGEDVLVKLHGYLALLMRAEGQNIILDMEIETEGKADGNDSAGIVGDNARRRLTLTGARFAQGQAIYTRPDTGREIRDDTGQELAALSASASSGGLVSNADTSAL